MQPEDDRPLTSTRSATAVEEGGGVALERGDELGRYIVLARLGAGGMGVVYAAYDPDLDRKLAVKVLRPNAADDEERLLREGRAMARVQHPNVITVHDVGTFSHRVFVAMELVDGVTLSRWLEERPRDWRAIVDVFVQAGRGLAAAHAVGLVHRDFKPANVLVGADGRVRVVDFGLARSTGTDAAPSVDLAPGGEPVAAPLSEVTRTGTLVGTPSYMSPEQLHRQPVDGRSDQFSFSVALYRALFGERPFGGDNMAAIAAEIVAGRLRPPPKASRVPTWVQKVVLRGLAARAEERWPTMEAMLAALQHDPVRIRRRWILGSATAAGVLLLAVAQPFTHRSQRLCGGIERKLAGVWDDATRARVHAAFAMIAQPDGEAAFARVARALDGWAREFTEGHTEACEATRVRHELSEDLLDLRMQCLGEQLEETKAQVALFTHADAQVVDRSMRMISALSTVGSCSDLAALRAPMRLPPDAATRARVDQVRKDIARAKVLNRATKYDEARPILQAALAAARSAAYRPVEAEALVQLGYIEEQRGKYEEAEKLLLDAVVAARGGRHAIAEVNAWTELVRVSDMQSRYDEAQQRGRYGLAAFEAIGATDQRPLARLLHSIGTAAADQGRYEEALASAQRALAIRQGPNGGDSIDLAAELEAVARVLGNLGRNAEAEQQIRRALAIYERETGPENHAYASCLFNLGYALFGQARYEEALVEYRRTIAIWERTLGRDHPRLALALTNVGDLLRILGRYDEALRYDRRALAIAEKAHGPEHPDVALALSNLADVLRLQHKHDEALENYGRALAICEKKLVPDHPYVVWALIGIGETELDRKQPSRAVRPLERAVGIAQKHSGDPLALADAQFALARAEWDAGGDRAAARARATAARPAYGAARNHAAQLAAVDAWLAKHGR